MDSNPTPGKCHCSFSFGFLVLLCIFWYFCEFEPFHKKIMYFSLQNKWEYHNLKLRGNSFVLCNCFIGVRIIVNLQALQETMAVSMEMKDCNSINDRRFFSTVSAEIDIFLEN